MAAAAQGFDGDENERKRPSPAEIREQFEHILASPAFAASARRRALLRYLIEESLAGRADRLKGFTIAVAVFGRDETFDPQTDPVVRLEARRLRRDLDGYYATAGRADRVRISIPKGGYVPEAEWAEEPDAAEPPTPADEPVVADGAAADASTVPTEPSAPAVGPRGPCPRRQRERRLRLGLIVLGGALAMLAMLVIAHVGFGLWVRLPVPPPETTDVPSTQARGPAVIVPPFEALSLSEEDRHLAAGLTQQLITDLMRFDAFRIYAVPGAVGPGPAAGAHEADRRLDVAYVVKGNVRSDGGMVRVGVQLVDRKTGELLFSETYDYKLTPDNLLLVQETIANQIATRLGQPYGVVRSITTERLNAHRPRTMFAYQCVLRVYDYRRTFDRARQAETQACLEEAVRHDPDYPEAWAFLGWLRMDPVRFGLVGGDEAAQIMNQALADTSRAVSLSPSNSIALQASAVVAWYRGEHEQSERTLRQALTLNPNDPDIMAQLGWRLAARGRWTEGLDYLSRAIDRTISPPAWYFAFFAIHDYLEGNYAKALVNAELAKASGFGIGWSVVAATQAALGNQEKAREALVQMTARSPPLARDPPAAYRIHQIIEPTIDALMAGLRKAGWREPTESEAHP